MAETDEMDRSEAIQVLRQMLGTRGLLALCVIMETMPISITEIATGEHVENWEKTLSEFSLELLPEPCPKCKGQSIGASGKWACTECNGKGFIGPPSPPFSSPKPPSPSPPSSSQT